MTAKYLRLEFERLSNIAEKTLKEEISAQGGIFRFKDIVIAGQLKHGEGTEDIIIKEAVIENDNLVFYGSSNGDSCHQKQKIDYIEPNYYAFLLDEVEKE